MASFEASTQIDRPTPQVLRYLQDMRNIRKVLPATWADIRPYGPQQGKGARLAAILDQLGLQSAGALTLAEVEEDEHPARLVMTGEFPPVNYRLTFEVSGHSDTSCSLSLHILATPQKLAWWRMRSRRALQWLDRDLPLVSEGITLRLKQGVESQALDSSFVPVVTTDGFVEACEVSRLSPNTPKLVKILKKEVALFMIEGQIYATSNACPHQGGPLAEGQLEGKIVTCPWHHWTWDVTTGKNSEDPHSTLPTWPCRVEDGKVLVRVNL